MESRKHIEEDLDNPLDLLIEQVPSSMLDGPSTICIRINRSIMVRMWLSDLLVWNTQTFLHIDIDDIIVMHGSFFCSHVCPSVSDS